MWPGQSTSHLILALIASALLLQSLRLPLGPRAPVRVVDGGVLEKGGEYEDEAHDEVDIDGLHV